MNRIGVKLYYVYNYCSNLYSGIFSYGFYIVNNESELIYIDRIYNINKFLKCMKIVIIFIEKIDFVWILICVYWFFIIDNFLVGMYREELRLDKFI